MPAPTEVDIYNAPFVPSTAAPSARREITEMELLKRMLALLAGVGAGVGAVPGLAIPAHDYISMTYVGSTNNINTIIYKTGGSGGVTVATLTFTYVAAGAADDDDIATITKS